MKKIIITGVLLFSMIIPTITSYANWTKAVPAPKSFNTQIYVDPQTMPGGKDNPWAGTTSASIILNYPGRIEGTWQKRGEDFYYVLSDGTDLKNNYVDGLYLGWTGKMIRNMYPQENVFLYNNLFGGEMPTNSYFYGIIEGNSDGLMNLDLSNNYSYFDREYKAGNLPRVQQARETIAWMDSHMPTLLALPEKERAIAIGKLIADRVDYKYGTPHSAAEAYVNKEGSAGMMAQLYTEFVGRAGITEIPWTSKIYNGGPVRLNDLPSSINQVTIGGVRYWVDIVAYDTSHNESYLLSERIWDGYISHETYEEAQRIETEKSRRYSAMLDDFRKAYPKYAGGITMDQLRDDEYMAEYNKVLDEFEAEWERTH